MKRLALLFLVLATPVAAQQYAHARNPGTFGGTPRAVTSAGSGHCPGTGCVLLKTEGRSSLLVQIGGTYAATLAFYCTNDETNFTNVNGYPVTGGGLGSAALNAGANGTGTWWVPTLAFAECGVYASAFSSNTSMAVNLDADPGTLAQALMAHTTTTIAPAGGNLTAATATSVYAGAAGTCGVDVTNLSTTIAMTCGTTSAVSATVGTYTPPLGTYSTPAYYGGTVYCYPASGTPAYSTQAWSCP